MVKFTYNGRIYAPADLDKKLKKLGITRDDIEIIQENTKPKEEVYNWKYQYRVNVNTILCAGNEDNFNRLKKWYNVE